VCGSHAAEGLCASAPLMGLRPMGEKGPAGPLGEHRCSIVELCVQPASRDRFPSITAANMCLWDSCPHPALLKQQTHATASAKHEERAGEQGRKGNCAPAFASRALDHGTTPARAPLRCPRLERAQGCSRLQVEHRAPRASPPLKALTYVLLLLLPPSRTGTSHGTSR
jgi:hypothetical protein